MSKETEIKAEIAEYQAILNDSTVPQDERDFAKEEIKDLEAQLEKWNAFADRELGRTRG